MVIVHQIYKKTVDNTKERIPHHLDTARATRILLLISTLALFRVVKYTTLKSAK